MKLRILFSAFFLVSLCSSCEKKQGEATENLSDTLKQKNGTILTYQKPPKNLIFLKRDQSTYSEDYQARLRKISEYYLANSKQNLINFHQNKGESNLGYSVEENDWEGTNYTQIGIFNKSGSNISTLQWLFYEPQSQKLYEFDLNKKKLTEFNLK